MLPQLGKIDRKTFDRIILPQLGKDDASVLIGPQHGVDAAVIELPDNQVMVIAEDPTFGLPVLMPYFGWCIVHICASDVAVLGVRPRYLTICLLLSPETPEGVLGTIWKQIHEECTKLGIAVVGGHTGMYPGISYPLNGGCTVIGLGTKDQITPASNAKIGDRIIITKGPAIEATGILAIQGEKELERKFGKVTVQKAKGRFFDMSVIEEALLAAPYAHAMHDATEGGLLNGIYEVAAASQTGVNLYEDRIIIPDDIRAVCSHFDIDPLISISEGSLVIAATPENAAHIQAILKQKKIDCWDIGEVTGKDKVFIRNNGNEQELLPVAVDPFWAAYFSTLKE